MRRIDYRMCLILTVISLTSGLVLADYSRSHNVVSCRPLPTRYASAKFSDWSAPENVGSTINSEFAEFGPGISKDGLSLYFASNRPGGVGGEDMWVSQRSSLDKSWGPPMNLGPNVNTTSNERNPAFSTDGHMMFFQSTRPGGLGGADIWVSQRDNPHDDFGWQPPVNLGAGVNSAQADTAPSYFEDDDLGTIQLYFSSNRLGGLGDLDIYVSTQNADGSFGPAVLVPELSSAQLDARPSIRHDGREIIFHSRRLGGAGGEDLWVSTRETTSDEWSAPVNLGSVVNTTFTDGQASLSFKEETLFFASDRPGGFGTGDLYTTTRVKQKGESLQSFSPSGSISSSFIKVAFTLLRTALGSG